MQSTETLPSISAQRHVEPARLTRLVRGELDWIVMKGLEKDRARRYETASGLARDIEHYLNDEPVEAGPPSASYRLRKYASKHRMALATSAAFIALLVLGTVISVGQALRDRAETVAQSAEQAARSEQRQAVEERNRAEAQSAVSRAVTEFLQKDLLAQASPALNARREKMTVESLLDRAATKIAGRFDQQPQVEAVIRRTIGDTYFSLGLYPQARPHLERSLDICRRALGSDHPETLAAMNSLGELYRAQGEHDRAEKLLTESSEGMRRVLGPDHPDTLGTMNNLASLYQDRGWNDRAEALWVKTLATMRRVLGPEHHETLSTISNLAVLYPPEKAEPLYMEALDGWRR